MVNFNKYVQVLVVENQAFTVSDFLATTTQTNRWPNAALVKIDHTMIAYDMQITGNVSISQIGLLILGICALLNSWSGLIPISQGCHNRDIEKCEIEKYSGYTFVVLKVVPQYFPRNGVPIVPDMLTVGFSFIHSS